MLINGDKLRDVPILSIQAGGMIARTGDPIIDPDELKVVGFKIVGPLAKKGIDKEIAEQVLDIRNDDEEIKKIIAKKSNRYDREKMINYLVRQGFPFETVRNLVSDFYGTDSQNLE